MNGTALKKLFLSIAVVFAFLLYSYFVNKQETSPLTETAATTPEPPPTGGSTPDPTPLKHFTSNTPNPTAQPTGVPTRVPTPVPTAIPVKTGKFRDGQYTGQQADAFYGYIQVKAIISGGKITDVQFLQYPNDRRTSIEINTQAMPMLKGEAISLQDANVDIISGATDSSKAFIQSLGSALSQAR